MTPVTNCLLFRLTGPMQAWSPGASFTRRETTEIPTKRGVIGVLAAALGLPRGVDLTPLADLRMGIRVDRPGVRETDFQTATGFVKANAKPPRLDDWVAHATYQERLRQGSSNGTEIIRADYLADAAFLVGVQSDDPDLLHQLDRALRAPVFPLFLGRKAFSPGAPVWLPDGQSPLPLLEAMTIYPWLGPRRRIPTPDELRIEIETDFGDPEGFERLDQPVGPLSSFNTVTRYVRSVTIPCPEPHNTLVFSP